MPGNISVEITVTGFTDIGAVSLSLDYDYSVIQFLQGIPNPLISSFLSGDYNLGNGFHRVNMGWYGSSTSLPDNSVIMTLNFNYTAGNTALTWFDNGPSCEYADAMGNVLDDIPMENYYINGNLCGAIGDPGNITGLDTVCQGEQDVYYSIIPLDYVTGYNWTVPDGAMIVNGQNTNTIIVSYSINANSGNISVNGVNPCGNGPSGTLPVIVNLLPVANAGNDTTINYGTSTTLHASPGGTGNFSYHWSPEELLVNPDVQHPQTVIMTSTTVFNVLVTNLSSFCQSSDEMVLAITGGPLSVNPLALPADLCLGESSQLYANAGGGSENYTFFWTCYPAENPPWSSNLPNPVVTPDSSKIYLLSVNDGFSEINGSVNVDVFSLPTATISGGDTLCGYGNTTTLRVDLTGTPPWSFFYTNGITTWIVTNVYSSPYEIITGDPGTYTIINLQDDHCSGPAFGSASVFVFPYPAVPEITIIDFTLVSDICCGNQWHLNGEPIPGATGQAYVATVNGLYFDIVTINGCSSDTSEIIDLIVGINVPIFPELRIVPNPASNQVKISCPGMPAESIMISVISMDGRVMSRQTHRNTNAKDEYILDISLFRKGLYIVAISRNNESVYHKLIIN